MEILMSSRDAEGLSEAKDQRVTGIRNTTTLAALGNLGTQRGIPGYAITQHSLLSPPGTRAYRML
ncbi:hypothetical protein N7532_006421 [Penicillium argentinense]|uniref:Uncharacterized protein n=1 Tax=Penicillium argentinense TaxID=1131581 RepID=A0A9W9KAU5_9EURO|nr:uncharacterized protein N7532_006421 [Penicillium argentinense]KAJ5099420.1 hypothetical protein N7532_006421 [Penicillium argentinense]